MEQSEFTHTPTTEPRVRVARVDAAMAGCIAGAVVASVFAFSMSVTSFLDAKDAVLAVLLVPLSGLRVVWRRSLWGGVWAFLPLILLASLPVLVSLVFAYPHVPEAMHREVVRLGVLILFGILAFDVLREERYRRVVLDALVAAAAGAAVLAILQRLSLITFWLPEFTDAPDPLYTVFGNSGLLGGYLAMALPIAVYRAVASRVFVPYWVALAVISPAVALSGSRAAWIGSVVGTLLVLPWRELNIRRAAGTLAVIACTIGATFVQFEESRPGHWLRTEKKDTIRLRFWFWDGAARMAAAHPVVGVGPGNFGYWSPKFQGDALQGRFEHISNEAHTRYAHNEPLHFAAETGAIGIVLLAWMVLRLLRRWGVEWGGLAAGMVFALFHFPLHSAAHALVLVLLAAMLLARDTTQAADRTRIFVPALAVVAAVLCTAFTIWDVLLPSRALRTANVLFAEGAPSTDAYEAAIRTGRYHADAHANYANALLQGGELDAARAQLVLALRGQDTGDVHLALGYIALQRGDRAVAERHLRAAVHRWPGNAQARAFLGALGD